MLNSLKNNFEYFTMPWKIIQNELINVFFKFIKSIWIKFNK
jgi:hypothetical protein